jgi:hypothetical protein
LGIGKAIKRSVLTTIMIAAVFDDLVPREEEEEVSSVAALAPPDLP